MNDDQTTRNFDDELLSAYLDGELTVDERAQVDERLAADPEARALLDQLQSVSQAVCSLPSEPLGRDLREPILRQAERAMLTRGTAAATAAATDDEPQPGLSIGRSARGWMWAGLAVAAALLLMVLQPGVDPDAERPELAARSEPRAERAAARSDIELRADDEPGPAVAESAIAATAPPEDPTDDVFDEPELVVVHLNVTPAALQNKMLDETLARHGIAVEEEGDDVPLAGARARRTRQARTLADSDDDADQPPEFDVVLVEAPPAQVESFMTDLGADLTNYLGIEVEDAAGKALPARHLSAERNWAKFSRGAVPAEQKAQLPPALQNNAGVGVETRSGSEQRGIGGAPGQVAAGRSDYYGFDRYGAAEPLGRAMRVPVDDQERPEDLQQKLRGGRAAVSQTTDGQATAKSAPPDAEQIQMLFVLTCSDPTTPSPIDADRAE